MTGLAVLVAAFVVFGTVMAREITVRTTLDHFSDTPAATSVVAVSQGDGSGITEALTDAVRQTPGVAEATARTGTQVPLSGVFDRLLELKSDPGRGQLSRLKVMTGAYPRGGHKVAVNEQAARHWDIEPGDLIRMQIPRNDGTEQTRRVTVTVTGVVAAQSDRMEAAYASAAAINAMSDLKGSDRLDIRTEPGVSSQALSQRLSTVFNSYDTRVETVTGAEVRAEEARGAVSQYEDFFLIVAMFLAITVVAAALVATSTFRVVFAQRVGELALLRMIGAHRHQLVRSLAAEGAVVGLAAGTAGVVLALVAGHAAPTLAGLAGQDLSAPGTPVGAALAVVAGAALTTVAAVLAPAVSAAGVSPLQALRNADTLPAERGIGKRRLSLGLTFAAAAAGLVGIVLAHVPDPGDSAYEPSGNLAMIVLSGTLAFLALVALGPVVIRPVLAAAGWPLRRLGPVGNLAVGGMGGAPRRAASVSLVVALGITLVSGTFVGITTMRSHADGRLALQAPADFALDGPEKGLAPGLVRRVEKLPQLADTTSYRQAVISVEGAGTEGVSATDMDLEALPSSSKISAATGNVSALGPGRVILGATLAEDLGVRAGDNITLKTARGGDLHALVAATLPEEGPLAADMVLSNTDLDATGVPPGATGVLANAAQAGPAGRNAAATSIAEVSEDQDDVHLRTLAQDRERSDDDITLLATMALGLLGLTVLIAVVGVATTTGLTVRERTRESGLLRALGLSRSGLRTSIGLEAGLYGALGSVLGLALGVAYAWLVIQALNLGSPLHLPYAQLGLLCAGLTAVTMLTGLLLSRHAARVSPVTALGTEE
ncbi:FtsX-like permease family protein [Streptomyces sp. NPDC057718]|uniref:FtsX-like permease family protein n=1 Tax=Streptomyces sp. NPDC057718 TaxID=3346225 RepID=UPI0036C8A278